MGRGQTFYKTTKIEQTDESSQNLIGFLQKSQHSVKLAPMHSVLELKTLFRNRLGTSKRLRLG